VSGVPVGVHMDVPVIITSGWPSEVTREAPKSHCAVTHGPLPVGGAKAHPATLQGALVVVAAMPETMSRVLGTVGVAWPPWAQITVAP
jgi:hypothetical protein